MNNISKSNFSFSLLSCRTTLSLLRAALKKKERTTKRNPERRDDESTTLSLSSYLTSLVVFINNTPQFKDDFTFVLLLFCVKFFFLTSRRRELAKKKKTLNTRVEKRKTQCFTHCVEIPAQRHKTENTHNNMGVSILYISNSLLFAHKRYPFRRIRRFRCDGTFAR